MAGSRAVRAAVRNYIYKPYTANDISKFERRCVTVVRVARWLSKMPLFKSRSVESLLSVVAASYISSRIPERDTMESPVPRAFADFGRVAGEQLVRAADDFERKAPGAFTAARGFGMRIVEGKACGSHHVFDQGCTCTRCGDSIHDFTNECVCKRCGFEQHEFDMRGVYNGYFHRCKRCGAERHVESGNIRGSTW